MSASSGPWNFFRNTYGYSITSAQGWEIARLPLHAAVASMGASYTELPARDNACLVAAAPELLAALEKIVECEKARARDLRHRKAWELVKFSDERVAAAEAAIAKARGIA